MDNMWDRKRLFASIGAVCRRVHTRIGIST